MRCKAAGCGGGHAVNKALFWPNLDKSLMNCSMRWQSYHAGKMRIIRGLIVPPSIVILSHTQELDTLFRWRNCIRNKAPHFKHFPLSNELTSAIQNKLERRGPMTRRRQANGREGSAFLTHMQFLLKSQLLKCTVLPLSCRVWAYDPQNNGF